MKLIPERSASRYMKDWMPKDDSKNKIQEIHMGFTLWSRGICQDSSLGLDGKGILLRTSSHRRNRTTKASFFFGSFKEARVWLQNAATMEGIMGCCGLHGAVFSCDVALIISLSVFQGVESPNDCGRSALILLLTSRNTPAGAMLCRKLRACM